MKPESTSAPRDRKAFAKFMKVAISVCIVLMAAGAITLALPGGVMSPAARASGIGGIGCLAGAFVVLFRSMQKLTLDPTYQLSGKGTALLLALGLASIALISWATAL